MSKKLQLPLQVTFFLFLADRKGEFLKRKFAISPCRKDAEILTGALFEAISKELRMVQWQLYSVQDIRLHMR